MGYDEILDQDAAYRRYFEARITAETGEPCGDLDDSLLLDVVAVLTPARVSFKAWCLRRNIGIKPTAEQSDALIAESAEWLKQHEGENGPIKIEVKRAREAG